MAKRVFLHVASTKTGTTFLQRVLWAHRDKLLEQQLLLPGRMRSDHFRACLDVRDQARPDALPGSWLSLVQEMAAWPGDALVSHELFAPATEDQAAQAIGLLTGAEVHLVVTARDLARQIPAEWQEHLKHGSVLTFPEFVREVRTDPARGPYSPNGYHFWDEQDVPGVIARWGGTLPPERVHVVTVPRPGSRPGALWSRFTDVVGVDGTSFDLDTGRANSSLLAEQAELLRLLNLRPGARRPIPNLYAASVKSVLAQQILPGRPGTRFGLVGEDREFAVARAVDMVADLRRLRVDVVGDLAELVPDETSDEVSPDARVAAEVLLDEAVDALAEVLDRLSTEQARRRHLREQLDRSRAREGGRGPRPETDDGQGLGGLARSVVQEVRRRARRP